MSGEKATKSLFITGVGTDVGKTFISAMIYRRLSERGHEVSYYKPIQTGGKFFRGVLISPDCEWVGKFNSDLPRPVFTHSTYVLKTPASPHFAAEKESIGIVSSKIISDFNDIAKRGEYNVVEGAGGLYVPVAENFYMYDIPSMLEMYIALAAPAGLGSLNHVLLNHDFILKKRLRLKAILLVQASYRASDIEINNLAVLKKITGSDEIYLVPRFEIKYSSARICFARPGEMKKFPGSAQIERWFLER
jgi:dethiobiotin synthetase